jgi:predicted transcriptional regulator
MVLVSVDAIEAPEFKTVPADENLRSVITKMLDKNYSQLGLTKRDEVIGAISFRSISRALLVTEELFDSPKNLADRSAELAIEQPKRIHSDDSIEDLFDARSCVAHC